MKKIVVFGAGKSATSLIEYLAEQLSVNDWSLTVADSNEEMASAKVAGIERAAAKSVNVENENERESVISEADIVISLMPPSLHHLIAKDCLRYGKNLLTASYIDPVISSMAGDIKSSGLLFLCELGLDPGIDHMSAMEMIDGIRSNGGEITSFHSHCGGLVAPESDDNPWHYKISWNPKNIINAGKAGARFILDGKVKELDYLSLFDPSRVVDVPGLGLLSWYPNRDSIPYQDLYGLHDCTEFVRTTLRYPEFCFGWRNLIELKLTDENIFYETDDLSLEQFFQQHLARFGFSEWVEKQLTARFQQTRELLEKLQELLEAEADADPQRKGDLQDFMMVNNSGNLENININEVKTRAAATVAGQMHEANLSMKQLLFLGMDDATTMINKGKCSAADVLQFAMERKLALSDHDRDMVVMMHEIGYKEGNKKFYRQSAMVHKGTDSVHTAMAKTVGLPLGIAARLILQNKIKLTGLHIPTSPIIYQPVLKELQDHNIVFSEKLQTL